MTLSLKPLELDVWLLEQLRQSTSTGLTLEELQTRWKSNPLHNGILGRTTMTRHRKTIREFFGINIISSDMRHYIIENTEALALDSLANELLASVQEYIFLDEYRDLGDAIQPQQIWAGLDYLHPVGDAIRNRQKLKVRYQKFSDDEPYEAILHPYCLKACLGRWYILAVKEEDGNPVKTFALDRMKSLHVLEGHYKVDKSIDVAHYFDDAFGIWVDPDKYPVQDIQVTVPTWVSKYWKTLPLHHSQKVIEKTEDAVTFQFHLSPTPDFISELRKWGVRIN